MSPSAFFPQLRAHLDDLQTNKWARKCGYTCTAGASGTDIWCESRFLNHPFAKQCLTFSHFPMNGTLKFASMPS